MHVIQNGLELKFSCLNLAIVEIPIVVILPITDCFVIYFYCGYLWALQCRCPWSPEEGTRSPGAGVQVVVNFLMCVLGTELTLSAKALHTFLYLHFYVYGSIRVYFDHTPFSFPFLPKPFLISLLFLLQSHNLFIFTDCYCILLSI